MSHLGMQLIWESGEMTLNLYSKINTEKQEYMAVQKVLWDEGDYLFWIDHAIVISQNMKFTAISSFSEPVDIAEKAPFDISKDHMRVPTNEERIKQGVKDKHEQLRRVKSPRTVEQERWVPALLLFWFVGEGGVGSGYLLISKQGD